MVNLKSHAQFAGLAAVATGLGSLLVGSPAIAFTSVTGVDLGSFTDGADSTVNGITYGGQSLPITGVTAGTNWTTAGGVSTSLTLQRSSGGTANQIVWSEREGGALQTTVRTDVPSTTQAALAQTNIFQGTDNLFTNFNDNTPNFSNVERADFLAPGGITSATNLGASIFERGVATGHDSFKIAAITGLDGFGTPNSFGSLLSISNWGTTPLRTTTQTPAASPANPDYTVLNEGTTGSFTNTANLNNGQNIGGVLIPLSELAAPGTTIYGYALFGNDTIVGGTCTAAGLADINNTACYPTTTAQANGGIDLMAGNFGVLQEVGVVPVPVPPQFIGTALSALLAAWKVRSGKRKNNQVA
jgi:hypothetical protein